MVESLAIEGVTAQLAQAPANDPGSAGSAQIHLPVEPMQQPSAAQAADFSHAAAMAVPNDMRAALPSASNGLVDRIAHEAETLAARLKVPDETTRSAEAATGEAPQAGLDKGTMASAVSQMERAYMFAIETTMASRGSTESTKIFNTLLKGQ